MINILFIIESLNCGGAEKSLVSLLQSLDYDKVGVTLLINCDDLTPIDYGYEGGYRNIFVLYLPKQVRLLRIKDMSRPHGIKASLRALTYSLKWRSARLLHNTEHRAEMYWRTMEAAYPEISGHYDVAVAYQQGLPTYFIASKVSATTKIAWVNTDLSTAGYDETFNARYYSKYDHVVTVSELLYKRLSQSGYIASERLSTIYDILNTELIRKMAHDGPTGPARRHATRLVTVGRFEKAKNYHLAVEAARVLHQRGVDFEWTFVGTGSLAPRTEELAESYGIRHLLNYTGMQANPYGYMREADIYVQTSSFEGFGLTIAEAKILNKPIVSTNFSVVHDQLRDGVNGLIADMTPESVADKIMAILGDDSLRKRLIAGTQAEANSTQSTEVNKFYRLIGL